MDNSDHQLPLFGFKENLPHLKLKKIVSKERIDEMNALYKKGDMRSVVGKLEDLQESLDRFEKRIKNGK